MVQNDGLVRYTLLLLAVVLTVVVLYFGRDLFLLFVVSGLFAFLLLPLSRRMERFAPRWVGAMVATLLLIGVVLGIFFFLGWQLSRFGKDLPALQDRFVVKGEELRSWMELQTRMDRREQIQWFNEHISGIASWGGKAAMQLFAGTGSVLTVMVPIPIFVFLLLLLKDRFRIFFKQLGGDEGTDVLEVMIRISKLSRKYLKGVLTVILILGVMTSAGFLLIGLKYAILLGFLVAFLNVVPYIGVLVGSLIPLMVAFVTKDSPMYMLAVLIVCGVTQFLENNFITPKVVGSSVSLNPLASMVALLAFASLWGVAGMVLALPITGMLKVICDSIPSLRPWGYLLGEEIVAPQEKRMRTWTLWNRPGAGAEKGKERPVP